MNCAILIIGSLFWDDKTIGRAKWRDERLDVRKATSVRAPIQYGRKSSSRGNSYTMTFHAGESSGTGCLVPCTVATETVDDLIAEAQALWRVEAPTARGGELHKSWGCVGALFRDRGSGLSEEWSKHFKRVRAVPTSAIDENGILHLAWPKQPEGRLLDIDIILATATKPAPAPPGAQSVANAWLGQSDGNESYFFNNIKHGIRTSNDLAIWRHLEKAAPAWLSDESYAEAISILRAEISTTTGQ